MEYNRGHKGRRVMAIFNGWQITRAGVVFVVGIIILVGLVFGGVWLASDRGEQARRQEAAKIAQENLENQSQAETATNGAVTDPETTESDDEEVAVATPRSASTLPETGAEVSQVVIVALLALAGAYYVTSRRAAREL
jgi:LPXTG-motif cell wall-anchored protein